jgi:hypothetical protein
MLQSRREFVCKALRSAAGAVVSGLADRIKENQLKIVAGYYDLSSGKVTLLG